MEHDEEKKNKKRCGCQLFVRKQNEEITYGSRIKPVKSKTSAKALHSIVVNIDEKQAELLELEDEMEGYKYSDGEDESLERKEQEDDNDMMDVHEVKHPKILHVRNLSSLLYEIICYDV